MRKVLGVLILTGLVLCSMMAAAAPQEILLQGVLTEDGNPLSGERAWRVQYYDAETDGNTLGAAQTGTCTVSENGRWSLKVTPPSAVLNATGEVWFELAVDSAASPDGTIDAEDVFQGRTQVESVLFARRAEDADTLDGMDSTEFATDAELTNGLAAKSDTGHGHAFSDITGSATDAQIPDTITIDEAANADTLDGMDSTDFATTTSLTTGLAAKSDTGHNHDSRYYTESEVNTALAGKSDTSHNHDTRYYTESEVETALSGKSDTGHGHAFSEITGTTTDAQIPDDITITEADTLDSVTGRGATTANVISAGGISVSGGPLDLNLTTLDSTSGIYHANTYCAQSFTPVRSGQITGVSLPLACDSDGTNRVAEIRIISGAPAGSPSDVSSVETVTVLDDTTQWYSVTFDSPVNITGGQTYAIAVEGQSTQSSKWSRTTEAYADGAPFYDTGSGWTLWPAVNDFAFQIATEDDDLFVTNATDWQVEIGGPATLADQGAAPASATEKLYNAGGNLYWGDSALGQGIPAAASQYVVAQVAPGNTDLENATALQAALTAARAMSPSSSNRVAVIVPPGRYDLGTGAIELDTEYMELIGMTTNRGGQYIYGESNGASSGVIEQTADYVRIENLKVECTRGAGGLSSDETDPAAYFPDVTFDGGSGDITGSSYNTVIRNCEFVSDDTNALSMRGGADGGTAIVYYGWYEDCKAGERAFGFYGEAAGTFINCTASGFSFAYDDNASGVFRDCVSEGDRGFGSGGSATGSFYDCTCEGSYGFGGYPGTASGTFRNCVSGNYGFGFAASGTFINCEGGLCSFGGWYNGSSFSGTAINCTAGNKSFGGRLSMPATASVTSDALLKNCYINGTDWDANCAGTLHDCHFPGDVKLTADARLIRSTIEGDVDLDNTAAKVLQCLVDTLSNAGSGATDGTLTGGL